MIEKFSDLLGQTIESVDKPDEYGIFFNLENGGKYALKHYQDCCEDVHISDICGELQDLIGTPITQAEEVVFDQNHQPEGVKNEPIDESFLWTFYKLGTNKGGVTIRWVGSSSGYYSESVDFVNIEL